MEVRSLYFVTSSNLVVSCCNICLRRIPELDFMATLIFVPSPLVEGLFSPLERLGSWPNGIGILSHIVCGKALS